MYQIKKDSNGFFYVCCKADNAKTLWRSEPFKTKQNVWVFLKAVAKTVESPSELTFFKVLDFSPKDKAKEYHLNVMDCTEEMVQEYKKTTKQ